MGGAEMTSSGKPCESDGAGAAGGGVRGMWGVGVVSGSGGVIWMGVGLVGVEVGLGGCGRDLSAGEEAGCAVLSVGEWNSKKSDIKMFPGLLPFSGV